MAADPREAACPVPVSTLERVLAAAARLGAGRLSLAGADGRLLAAAGADVAPAGTGTVAGVEAPVLAGGAVVATVRAEGAAGDAASRAALALAAETAAAWIGDVWVGAGEVESLAGEIIHVYEELHLLYELGESLTSQRGVDATVDFVLQAIVGALHATWAELCLADGSVRACGERGDRQTSSAAPRSVAGEAASCLTTTLRSAGQITGSLLVARGPEAKPFSSIDAKLLDAVGTLAANAIRNAQLHDESRRQAEALRESEAHLRAVMDNVADGIITLDEQGAIRSFNPAAEQIFGYRAAEVVGRHVGLLLPPADAHVLDPHLGPLPDVAPAQHPGLRRREAAGRRRDGSTFPMDVAISHTRLQAQHLSVVSIRDITERKRAEQLLEHQALHDSLTGLPNRTLLHDRLRQALLAARRDGRGVALLVMDLDRFKEVNDTFGHHCGDLLLRQVGTRIQETVRSPDTVARLGGDEFAILLSGTDAAGAVHTALRLLRALERPFLLEGQSFDVGASIGIALSPEHGDDGGTLLRRADVAMYLAKRNNSGYAMYALDQDDHSPDRLALVGDLRRAIERGELVLHYQPKVDCRTQKIVWVEALVRWQHPQRGELRPDEFIPLAEQTGLIRPLSLWVLDAALRQCRAWRDAGLQLPVAVNLSMRNLHDWELPNQIARLLQARGVPPSLLKVEITESSLMADPVRAMHILARLKAMDVQVAIDDFGTGYSSLAYLKDLPVSEIKIDKSFVRQMVTDRNDAAIVRSTIGLSHELGLKVVAEGVEDQATWDLLASLGCDLVQGFYVSRPLAAADFIRWLNQSAWSPGRAVAALPAAT